MVERAVPSQGPGPGFTAMGVDDHPLVRESMVARLMAMGARDVVEAASVAEARARAHAGGPRDLCVLDVGLPDGSGLDLLADLRAAGWPRLVVLYFLWEAMLLTLVWRLVFVTIFSRRRFRQRAIVVGSGPAASLALSTIRQYRARQVDVVGFVPEAGPAEGMSDLPRLDGGRLLEAAAELGASELVLALRDRTVATIDVQGRSVL